MCGHQATADWKDEAMEPVPSRRTLQYIHLWSPWTRLESVPIERLAPLPSEGLTA